MWKKVAPWVLIAALLAAAVIWRLAGRTEHAPVAGEAHGSAAAVARAAKPPPAPASLAGRITNKADGHAIAGAIVAIGVAGIDLGQGLHQDPPTLVTSDASGAWTVPAVRPGTYDVTVTAAGFLPASHGRFVVAPAEHRTGIDLALEAGGVVVKGTVTDVGGGPVAGARIGAIADRGLAMLFRGSAFATLSGADGKYELSLGEGPYHIAVHHDDYVGATKTIEVAGKPVVADFTLTPAGTIRGQVIARDTGKPVAQASVRASGHGSGGGGVTTDDEGRFTLKQLRSGAIAVTAAGGGYASSAPTTVELGIGEQVDGVRVVVDHAFSISGKIVKRGDTAHGLSGVIVGAFSMGTKQEGMATEPSAADGSFEVFGMRPGSYMLFAIAEHAVPVIGKPVEVVDHDVTGVVVEMATGVKLSGRVAPPGPASIALSMTGDVGLANLFDALKAAFVHAEADASGAFVLDNVPSGKLAILATTQEGPAGKLSITVGDTDQQGLVVTLETRGSIAGHVIDTNHAPVAGVRVDARAIDRPMSAAIIMTDRRGATTDDAGAFKLVGLEPGKYRVKPVDLEDLDFDDDETKETAKKIAVELAKGEAKTGVVVTVEARDGVIRGVVIGSDGQPAADAWVTAYRPPGSGRAAKVAEMMDWNGSTPVLTADGGKFKIDRLRKGEYRVVADGPRGAARAEQSGVKPGDAVTLTLQPLGVLTGHLTARGAPVASYTLACAGPAGRVDRQVTAADGGYSLEHLAPGSYDCAASADAGTAHGKVDVPPGTATLDLALVGWASLTGVVVSVLTGQPVPGIGAVASGARSDGREIGQALIGGLPSTDATGRFTVDKIAEGTGKLLLFAKAGTIEPVAEHDYTATAGQRIDVGTIKVVPPRTTEAGTLGMAVADDDKGLGVASVTPGGPAAGAGIVAGDRITAIDGKAVAELTPALAARVLASGTIGIGVTVALVLERGQTVSITSVKW